MTYNHSMLQDNKLQNADMNIIHVHTWFNLHTYNVHRNTSGCNHVRSLEGNFPSEKFPVGNFREIWETSRRKNFPSGISGKYGKLPVGKIFIGVLSINMLYFSIKMLPKRVLKTHIT